jgi:SagB-type dehydrogenase family enzyme
MIAADVMARLLITVGPEAELRHALGLMLRHRLGALPVVDVRGRLAGMLSEGDLLRRAWLKGAQPTASVGDMMSASVISVAPDASLEHVLGLMQEHHIKRVPVLRDGQLVGMLSRANLLQALMRVLPDAAPPPLSRHSDGAAPIGSALPLVETASLGLDSDISALALSLLETLKLRRSQRNFSPHEVPLYRLSRLLWAADGVNRASEHGRTAPSASNAQEIDIYVATAGGWYRYDAVAPALILCGRDDIRAATGKQDLACKAPLDLVYVANLERLPAEEQAECLQHAACDTGHISQNVYLFCAAEGMATVSRTWFDRAQLERTMGLGASQRVMLAQTVGYPA